jgi:hypothetical protein
MTPQLEKLADLCTAWGGKILEETKEEFNKRREEDGWFSEAPFTLWLGVNWSSKTIIYTGEVVESNVIHEMGHVFAANQPPRAADEFTFLGWEYVVAKQVGISLPDWLAANRDYVVSVDGDKDIGHLSKREIFQLIHDRVKASRKAGLVKGGKPLAIR